MSTKKDRSELQQIQISRRRFCHSVAGIAGKIGSASSNTNYITKKEHELLLSAKTILNEVLSEYLDTNKQFGLKVPEHRCFCGKGTKYFQLHKPLCYKHLKEEILASFAHSQYKSAENLGLNLAVYRTTEQHESLLKKNLEVIRYIAVDNQVYGAYLKDSNNMKWLYLEIKGNKFYYKFDNSPYISIFNIDVHHKVPKIIGINLIKKFIPNHPYLNKLLTKITNDKSTLPL